MVFCCCSKKVMMGWTEGESSLWSCLQVVVDHLLGREQVIFPLLFFPFVAPLFFFFFF